MANVKEVGFGHRLKEETKTAHQETEKVLVQWMKRISTKDDYAGILKMFYGYFDPLEHLIYSQISESDLPDFKERRKATRLVEDLAALDILTKPNTSKSLPTIQNNSHAFGALYVIEGSTLGGEVIVKMLKANLALQLPDAALSFFYGYRENNKQMWQKFQHALQEHVSEHNMQQVILAANETFWLLKKWMLQQHETTTPG